MNPLDSARLQKWILPAVVLAAGLALVPLYFFNPVEHAFFPFCVFHKLTGWDCPGCGGLRATHQLLHGHILSALKLNPLLVALLPLGAYFAMRQVVFYCAGKSFPQPFKSPGWAVLLAGVVIAFGVLRNLPWRAWFAG